MDGQEGPSFSVPITYRAAENTPSLNKAYPRSAYPVSRGSAPRLPIAMVGVVFDNVTLTEALARLNAMVASRQPHYVVTANVDFLVRARRDAELRRILLDAHLVLCDGTPLVWASRLLGNPLPERVAGSDLVPHLLELAARQGHRLFFLGASPEANTLAITNARKRLPGINIVGGYSPPFRGLADLDHAEICQRIQTARPDIVLVAFGCPKAEKWMAMNYRSLGVPLMIGVGGTLDFLAGRLKRAPLWMQRAGLEWAFRLAQEPRRLAGRYASDLLHFGWALAAQWWWLKLCSAYVFLRADEALVIDTVRRGPVLGADDESASRGVNLSRVEAIDSTGVAALLRLRRQASLDGHELTVLNPSRAVQRAFRLMRVQSLFQIAGGTT